MSVFLRENEGTYVQKNFTLRFFSVAIFCTYLRKKVLLTLALVSSYPRTGSEKLELFGRYLLPGWTTFGNEALKFQQLAYFHQENVQ